MTPPDIFSRVARRALRDKLWCSPQHDRWLIERMADELIDRLAPVRRSFERALIIGAASGSLLAKLSQRNIATIAADPGFCIAAAVGGVQCDEDRLPFADASFDLIISLGSLDTVNDLPGALVLIRRALQPEGLFLSALAGAGSLPTLRAALAFSPRAIARTHPMIDVRAAGDLLARAGFASPVADGETVTANYGGAGKLFLDLRANGLRNALAQRQAMTKGERDALIAALPAGSDTRISEQFALLYLTGWASATRADAQAG